jgi:excisionase family DNA binding protein
MNDTKDKYIPINQKYGLNITEAAQYFGIGETKLRQIIHDNPLSDCFIKNGNKTVVKREKFEKYLDEQLVI